MGRVLITTDYLRPNDDIDNLLKQHGHETTFAPFESKRDTTQQMSLLTGFDAAIIASEPITRDMLASAPSLKVLARSGVGYDSIDVQAASHYGVRVCNAPGSNHYSVAEMAIGLLIMSARHLANVTSAVRLGQWPRKAGHELHGATLGIIGYGPSGQATAKLGLALGMKVLVSTAHPSSSDREISFTDLDTVFKSADYLSLHSRASGTGPLVDEAKFELMKDSAIIINTARGSLINESALAAALSNGTIAGAALDVLDHEPMTDSSPLRGLENLIITSHLAGQTVEARLRAGMIAAQAVIDVLANRQPDHPVN
ncbi:phosphoglycerate dehydrogenase-like enzyme [Arthrobacter sp. JUb119]|uniref:phosphoglycerate dehydrogenase n=1 Tax=Glutamicibacter sp. 2E12 TaxID=3416181 RepID=UPI002A2F2768|nr:phosphoglycerate dehydrogenase-like enzyme [Arthrobacter sp. JUb119]